MQQALSSHLFVNHRLTAVWLERVQSAGFRFIEVFCARQHLDYRNKAQVKELGHWFRESNLKLLSLHSPMYSDEVWGRSGPDAVINIAETVKGKRIKFVDEIKLAIEVADVIPCQYMVQHIGVRGEEFEEKKMDAASNSLEELRVFAGQRGVSLLLENTPNELSTAARLNYITRLAHLNLNYCFDIGHAHMEGRVGEEFELMSGRIASTHIHDNDGSDDAHLFPLQGQGTIDWAAAMKMLGSRPDHCPLVLELREQAGVENPIELAKRIADGLTGMI